MTPAAAAVLLVPAEGDPLGLLAEGPCGARPPVAHRYGLPRLMLAPDARVRWLGAHERIRGVPAERALVLAWDGKPVVEGIDRLARLTPSTLAAEEWPDGYARAPAWLTHSGSLPHIVKFLPRLLEANGIGATLVLLDPTGAVLP